MKPLHVGLLIVGAALAGGLAVKMTELQPVAVASSPGSCGSRIEDSSGERTSDRARAAKAIADASRDCTRPGANLRRAGPR